ncbi:hypothetical protein D3C71_1515540 [compost metagenome]
MLEDCFCDSFRFSCFACIIFTHGALKFWEFINHLSHKVEFANISSPTYFRKGYIRQSQLYSKTIGDLANTTHFISNTAKLFMVDDILQFG